MAVKPPRDASWTVRNEIDFVDILPTIAKQVGASVPEQCTGVPIQEGEVQRPRITERIQTDYYNISVEIDGWKGIFTYEESYPGRPPEEMLGKPVHEEYYLMQSVRAGDFDNKKDEINQELKQQLQQAAEEFMISGPDSVESELETMSTQTKNQLEDLGYIE